MQKAQVATADLRLLEHAREFYAALVQITDLAYERINRQPTAERWWWYLDVLRNTPAPLLKAGEPDLIPA